MTQSQEAHDLGVAITMYSWVKDYKEDAFGAFPGKGKLTPQQKRLQDL